MTTTWTATTNPRYKAYSLKSIDSIPQLSSLPAEVLSAAKLVGSVLPVKTNNYVVEQLIDWANPIEDPLFILNFPQRGMLLPHHFEQLEAAQRDGLDSAALASLIHSIRLELNPHPAGQLEHNVPVLEDGTRLPGLQHKYRDTVLFFPSQGQTCHAYCSFCFRWPQFVGMDDFKFAAREVETLVQYVRENEEISDILFTGGDPMVMSTRVLRSYLEPVMQAKIPHLRSVRIGSKALSYWPYRFISD